MFGVHLVGLTKKSGWFNSSRNPLFHGYFPSPPQYSEGFEGLTTDLFRAKNQQLPCDLEVYGVLNSSSTGKNIITSSLATIIAPTSPHKMGKNLSTTRKPPRHHKTSRSCRFRTTELAMRKTIGTTFTTSAVFDRREL